MHQVGFLVADDFDGVFESRLVEIFDRLGLPVSPDGKERRTVFSEIRHAIDFGIAFDKALEAESRLAVIIEIERRGQLIKFFRPLQGPATVIVLEYPLAAEIQAGDRQPAEQGGGQNLDGQDFVHQHALSAISDEPDAYQPRVNRAQQERHAFGNFPHSCEQLRHRVTTCAAPLVLIVISLNWVISGTRSMSPL